MLTERLLISVITVCYNSQATIERAEVNVFSLALEPGRRMPRIP